MPLPTFQFQEDGADRIVRYERHGLHDEMGVGKSAQIVRAFNKIGLRRGLIVGPAMLRENWLGEFRKFSHEGYRIVKGRNVHDFVAWSRGRFHILVTGYELATRWANSIYNSGEPLDAVVLDEAHFLKNTATQRTQAILGPALDGEGGMMAWANQAWHVTGTPIANDPLDCYTFLRFQRSTELSKDAFVRRYFYQHRTAYGARHQVRPDVLDELRYLISNNSIRRTSNEVGLQLPPIFLTTMLVDGDTDAIRQMLMQYPGLEQAIVNAVQLGGLSFLDAQHISTLRRLVGESKAVPYSHILHEELETNDDKRVVYGAHRMSLRTVRDYLIRNKIGAVLVDGDTPMGDREEYIRMFQEDPACRVFIGNIKAAGTGITLTAACNIDMLESDWTPAGNVQAIKRIHRIGQTRTVRARFITLAKSLDETVTRVVAGKVAAIAEVEGFRMDAAPA